MKNNFKKASLGIILAILLCGCVPLEYTKGVKIDKDYPDKVLPIYDDAIVYSCEENDDEITLTAGSEDDVGDVIDFYQELLADEETFLLFSEKVKDDRYAAEGILIGEDLSFEIDITHAKGKVEEKLFKSQFEIVVAPQDEKTASANALIDENDAAVDPRFPLEVFGKYPNSIINQSGADANSPYIIMFTTDDIATVTAYYENFLASAMVTAMSTEDNITTWVGELEGYSFIIAITDSPSEIIEGYNTGIAIMSGIGSGAGMDNGANTTNSGEFISTDININQTLEEGGVKFTINKASLYENYKDAYGDASNGIMLDVTIENTNKDKTAVVELNYFNLVINTGESLTIDYWNTSSDISGEIMSEVIKNGTVFFPLNITKPLEVNGFSWRITAPSDKDYQRLGNDLTFSVTLDNPNFKLLTKETTTERVFSSLRDMLAENNAEIYELPSTVYQTGPVMMQIPMVALVKNYKDMNGNINDYIVVGTFIEAKEGVSRFSFNATMSKLVTQTKKQYETDYTFYQLLNSSFSNGSYTYGTYCFKLENGTADQITGFELYFDQPYDNETWDYLGDELVVTIDLK